MLIGFPDGGLVTWNRQAVTCTRRLAPGEEALLLVGGILMKGIHILMEGVDLDEGIPAIGEVLST